MFLENCEILENKLVAGHNYLMKVKGDKTVKAAKAGQCIFFKKTYQLTLCR